MVTIPQDFYKHTTTTGANFGKIYERLLTYYFEISESTINQFRTEKPGVHIRFEQLSEKDRYSTTLGGHKTAGFRNTYLSHGTYQCTIVKKNTSIIKNDLLPYLNRQVIVRDILPVFFQSFSNPTQRQFFHHYIELALPTIKEFLVRFLIAFESGEIGLENEIVDFVDLFYMIFRHEYVSTPVLQKHYKYAYLTPRATDPNKQAIRLIRKSKSLWLHLGLVTKEKFYINEVIPFFKLLEATSTQALRDDSSKEIYKNLKSYSVLFQFLS